VAFIAQAEAPPLREDAAGALRVGDSRVLLELVIRAFQDGATPETVVQRYSTLALPDVYAVIAYYCSVSQIAILMGGLGVSSFVRRMKR